MNLSSDDESYSSNDDDIASILHHQKETNTTILARKVPLATTTRGTECSDDDSDVSEDIDWEDATSVGKSDASEVPAPTSSQDSTQKTRRRAFPSRDVVIYFDDKSKDGKTRDNQGLLKKGKEVKNRRMKKIKKVPLHMQNLLRDLYRSHMMCAISRAIHLSSNLGSMENELWSVAYSSIPAEFMSDGKTSSDFTLKGSGVVPSYLILKKFSLWFFDYVSNVERRRQRIHVSNIAAGAPRSRSKVAHWKSAKTSLDRDSVNSSNFVESQHWGLRLLDMLSYLSPLNDTDPQTESRMTFAVLDKILLFCVMTRSLRWRVRLVTSLDPIKQDLTVEHPLFSTTIKNTFQAIVKSIEKGSKSKRKKTQKGQRIGG